MENLYSSRELRNYTNSISATKRKNRNFGNSAIFPSYCLFHYLLTTVSFLFLSVILSAQSGISTITAVDQGASLGKAYLAPGGGVAAQPEYIPSNGNSFQYNFGAASGFSTATLSVNGYMVNGTSYSLIPNVVTSVVMRRVDNSQVSGNRDILFFTGTRNPGIYTPVPNSSAVTMNLNAPYIADMGLAFFQNNLLVGSDNIFSNQGNGNDNNNNIERVDVMISGGFWIPNAEKYGFPILDRGGYGSHDAFKIAVITGLDGSGNPSSYSNVLSANAATYNNTGASNPIADNIYTYFLFKRDGSDDLKVNQHTNNQGIGGVSFRFSDFGITSGTVIYGYSIIGDDFNSTAGSDVVDYTNASHFPITTSESVGGLDLFAVMGIAAETAILPIQLSSFTATENNGHADLNWTTVTEINNKGFAVERSENNRDWQMIGFLPSKAAGGNSTAELYYSYPDLNPGKGNNYYRLRQVNTDNTEKFSETRMLSFKGASLSIQAYPNPVSEYIFVSGIEPGSEIQLTDVKGSVVYKTISSSYNATIPTGKMSPGIYFLRAIRNNTKGETIRLVKR